MKYIRTKDGIYEVIKEHKLPVGDDIFYVTDYKNFYSYEVLKQADTIPELCDVFRYVSKVSSYKRIYLSIEQLLKSEAMDSELCNIELCDIFGCIETDKGLIYVAKMKGILSNDEIDWKLL